MTNIYLIRHGQAANNVGGDVVVGNGPLTDLGVCQAERLRDRLAATGEIAADVLIASTMRRARRTAEIIAPALGLPVHLDEEVEEQRDGGAEGMTLEAIRLAWGPPTDWATDPRAPGGIPGGECPAAMQDRVTRALTRITAAHAGKTAVVVCHGGVIAAAMLFFQGFDTVASGINLVVPFPEHGGLVRRPWLPNYAPTTCSITHWQFAAADDAPGKVAWTLECYNDALHLRDLDSDRRIDWAAFARPAVVPMGA